MDTNCPYSKFAEVTLSHTIAKAFKSHSNPRATPAYPSKPEDSGSISTQSRAAAPNTFAQRLPNNVKAYQPLSAWKRSDDADEQPFDRSRTKFDQQKSAVAWWPSRATPTGQGHKSRDRRANIPTHQSNTSVLEHLTPTCTTISLKHLEPHPKLVPKTRGHSPQNPEL